MENSKSQKVIITVILVAVAVIIALTAAITYFLSTSAPSDSGKTDGGSNNTQEAPAKEISEADLEAMMDEAAKNTVKTDKPGEWYSAFESSGAEDRIVDIDHYRSVCPAVYAWIQIPGTDVDYPIAYCEDAVDPFYFTHDINGKPSEKGMIITDSLNRSDLSDPVTIIYGQNPGDGTMFSGLHSFRDPQFFEENDKINIFTDDAQLVYKIYACYIGASDHIFANRDFNDPDDFSEYFDSIEGIRDLSMNIRDSAKPSVTDHVITLVTHCDDESKRLFVQAVLDEVRY